MRSACDEASIYIYIYMCVGGHKGPIHFQMVTHWSTNANLNSIFKEMRGPQGPN